MRFYSVNSEILDYENDLNPALQAWLITEYCAKRRMRTLKV